MRLLPREVLLTDTNPVPSPRRFTGAAFSFPILATATPHAKIELIRLERGVRGDWHRHQNGQIIHVVAGEGYVGRHDSNPLHITAGDTVHIEADEEHWHGATPTMSLAQLAISLGSITWLDSDNGSASRP
ncbi:cupin domain-containing protein [Streptomyces spiralis]|uniref:cupin domain-containing protein n=1 Tax=Streptomyces spiralis TaxID=66376 RepID=UPI0036783B69